MHLISTRCLSVEADQQTSGSSERGRKWTSQRVGNRISMPAPMRGRADRKAGSPAAPHRQRSCSAWRSASTAFAQEQQLPVVYGGQAGGARNRRGRRVRRPLRGGRRGGDPLARRRLSRRDPLPGWRDRQEGRPALHHRPASVPGGLRRGQVAGRRRPRACSTSPRRSSSAPKSSPRSGNIAGLDARRPPARISGGAGADPGRAGGARASQPRISNSPRSRRRWRAASIAGWSRSAISSRRTRRC